MLAAQSVYPLGRVLKLLCNEQVHNVQKCQIERSATLCTCVAHPSQLLKLRPELPEPCAKVLRVPQALTKDVQETHVNGCMLSFSRLVLTSTAGTLQARNEVLAMIMPEQDQSDDGSLESDDSGEEDISE